MVEQQTNKDADWKEVRETNVGESPQLAVEIASGCFALKRFNVESIKNSKGEDCLGSVDGGGEKFVLKELDMNLFCIVTATGLYLMVCDAQSIHNTDNYVRQILLGV
jgi:hypothetical protein